MSISEWSQSIGVRDDKNGVKDGGEDGIWLGMEVLV